MGRALLMGVLWKWIWTLWQILTNWCQWLMGYLSTWYWVAMYWRDSVYWLAGIVTLNKLSAHHAPQLYWAMTGYPLSRTGIKDVQYRATHHLESAWLACTSQHLSLSLSVCGLHLLMGALVPALVNHSHLLGGGVAEIELWVRRLVCHCRNWNCVV